METEKIYYTESQIIDEFNELNCEGKINILYDAIDYMQSYNGRSKINCIAMAMGYDNYEGGKDTYYKQSKEDN
jgi:hypothetical protein